MLLNILLAHLARAGEPADNCTWLELGVLLFLAPPAAVALAEVLLDDVLQSNVDEGLTDADHGLHECGERDEALDLQVKALAGRLFEIYDEANVLEELVAKVGEHEEEVEEVPEADLAEKGLASAWP